MPQALPHGSQGRFARTDAFTSKTSPRASASTRPAAAAAPRFSTTTTTACSIIAITSAYGGANLYRNNGDGTFTDVSVDSGLDTATNTFGIAAGDYNNDGFTDLYVTRAGFYVGEGQLFRNNGDGTFTDVTQEAGLEDVWGPAFTASWVDYDNDGLLDLFVANNLGGLFERKTPNRLFHNNGDGTFTEVTEQAGLKTHLAHHRRRLGRLR